jgi:lipoprotein-anchoring transpeptidase ErfK/SrfK
MRLALATTVVLGVLASPAAARDVKLSDERSFTRTAEVRKVVPVRRAPERGSRRVGRLRRWTEGRFPETYLLQRRRLVGGEPWVRVRLPGRPNGRAGWVPADALRAARLVRWALVIDRKRLRIRLLRRGRVVWRAPVGIGAPGMETPRGRFWIREKFRGGGGIYGPWAFGTSAYSALSEWPGGGVIGLHGTNQPGLVPGRPSHGCVRLRNRDIRHLARRVPIGTPVRVR